MTSDKKRLRIRRTRQGIVIASVIGSAGIATGIGVSASAQAGADASQTGTVANQVSSNSDTDADDDYWGDPPQMASGSGGSHASSGGS